MPKTSALQKIQDGNRDLKNADTLRYAIDNITNDQFAEPVNVASGGTGVATLTGIPLGSGTSAFTAIVYIPWTDWTPTFTGFSADPSGGIYRYTQTGKKVTIHVAMPNAGTSNSTSFWLTLPVTASSTTDYNISILIPIAVNNSAESTTFDRANIFANAPTVIKLSKNQSITGWTASGTKSATFEMEYEAA